MTLIEKINQQKSTNAPNNMEDDEEENKRNGK
jgi:hypothetical protein